MSLRRFRALSVCRLPAAFCVLALLSCSHSPTAPTGRLVVYVSRDGSAPDPGKRIEIVETSQSEVTDENGLAEFTLPPGRQVVRAYGLNTPGPPPPFVERSVEIQSSRTSRVEFYDCTRCR